MTSTSTPTPTIDGPLLGRLGNPPDARRHAAMTPGGALAGHTTSDVWLPEGLSPAIDKLREEHLRRRGQVVQAILAVDDLRAGFKAQDGDYTEAVRQAYRVGGKQPSDERTSETAREALIAGAEERKWAALDVLEETVVKAIDTIRRDEDQLLGALRRSLAVSDEERLAAMRKVDEARVAAWGARCLAQWILGTSSAATVFSNQPAPVPSRPPDQFDEGMLATAFERHWTHRKPERTGLADSTSTAKAGRDAMPDVTELSERDDGSLLVSEMAG